MFRHNDVEHLRELLAAYQLRRKPGQCAFIVTESIFSMDGDVAPLQDIADVAEQYDAALIVDEAHATGCFGPAGSGLVDEWGLRERVLATVHTGGKALGLQGAYICCSTLLRDYMVNRCRHLIFTTAPSPAVIAVWRLRLPDVQGAASLRQRLHENARTFRQLLDQAGIKLLGSHYIVPVILGSDSAAVRAAEFLQSHGFDIRAIRPPTVPAGTARLRISIHAVHEPETLRRCAELVSEAYWENARKRDALAQRDEQ